MKHWIWGGCAAAVAYVVIASGVYEREQVHFDHAVTLASYRLDDAEEARREVAEDVQLRTFRSSGYETDPAYKAAQAKVDKALGDFPSAAGLGHLQSAEVMGGLAGLGGYLILLAAVALRRRSTGSSLT